MQNKIERNRNRDKEEQRELASMGWHCITVWECQLKPKVRQLTLEGLVYTLYHIHLEDRRIKPYGGIEDSTMIAAESINEYNNEKFRKEYKFIDDSYNGLHIPRHAFLFPLLYL